MKKTAALLLRIFDPYAFLVALLIAAGLHAQLSGTARASFIAFSILTMGPLITFRVLRDQRNGAVWDMSRRERVGPLAAFIALLAIMGMLLLRLANAQINDLLLTSFIWLAGFFVITLFSKVSGHVAIAVLCTGFLVIWFGPNFWPTLLFVPLISWARVEVGSHTLAQVFVGTVYSCVVLAILHR